MRRILKKTISIIVIVLCVGITVVGAVGVYFWYELIYKRSDCECVIRNEATEVAKTVSIDAGRDKFLISLLPPHQSRVIKFSAFGNFEYKCKVNFIDGDTLSENLGCITEGIRSRDSLTITDNSIEIDTGFLP